MIFFNQNSIRNQTILRLTLSGLTLIIISIPILLYIKFHNLDQTLTERSKGISSYIYISSSTNTTEEQIQRIINFIGGENDIEDILIVSDSQILISNKSYYKKTPIADYIKKSNIPELLKEKESSILQYKNQRYYFQTKVQIHNNKVVSNITIILKFRIQNYIKSILHEAFLLIVNIIILFVILSISFYYFIKNDILAPVIYIANHCAAYAKGLVLPIETYKKDNEIKTVYETLETMISDIEGQKKGLILAKETAQEAAESKSVFLSNMSHEIRTPLNSIIGFSDLLGKEDLNTEHQDLIEKVNASGKHLLSIINDILDVSKIDAGKMEIEKIPIDLLKIAEKCETLFSLKTEEKGIEFIINTKGVHHPYVLTDPTRLSQILLNLLSNAIKFTAEGKVELIMKTSDTPENKLKVNMSVIDSGIGIPEDKIKNLFTPFEQVDKTTTRKFGGTGLGLSICKKLTELMKGQISVESMTNQGTTFHLELTFDKTEIIKPKEEREIELDNNKLNQLKVLIAEDNKTNQILIRKFLEKMKIYPVIVDNGQLAYEELSKNKFDLLFMDIQMPVWDGIRATKEIRSNINIHQPIICALSANIFVEEKNNAYKAGMNMYLEKPLTSESLKKVIAKVLFELSDS
jgi:two-component system, sensor histidine kinase